MGMINVSSTDKNLEFTNLEAHVTLCAHRNQSIEKKINDLQEQHKSYRIYFMRFCIGLAVSSVSGAAAILFHVSGKL